MAFTSNADTSQINDLLLYHLKLKTISAPVNANNAIGTLTFTGVAVNAQTVTIDSDIYEFRTTGSPSAGHIAVDVSGGATASEAVTALVLAITNNTDSVVSAVDGSNDTVVVTALVAGISGNSIATTETCTNASWGNSTLLGGVNGTVCADSGIWGEDGDYIYMATAANTISDKNWKRIPKMGGNSTNVLDFSTTIPSTNTNGTFISTKSTWVNFPVADQTGMKLLCSSSSATGEYATMRMRARADAAGAAICGNFSASAGTNNHGNLYAVQGYAQPNAYTNTDASNIVCGVYSCIDAGGASSGRRWSTWIDTHETTKASGGDYLLRMSHNGTIANDGAITVYNGGRMPVLFNFEDAAGFLTDSGDAGSTKAGYIAVKTPAGTKYIQLMTT